jgi:hypothetical protein
MVMTHDVRALRLLSLVHHTREAVGLEQLSCRVGKRRSVYRWMQRLREHVIYYPRIAFAGLGLAHVHLFISNAGSDWFSYPYAIDRAWTVDRPGHHTLYLHCLMPVEHLNLVPQGDGITSITTGDGWQDLAPLEQALDHAGRPVPREATASPIPQVPVTTAWREHPFVLPVACELLRAPASMDDLWYAIHQRLGPHVWTYFTGHTRRWPHNGKAYVRHAFDHLNRYGLVLQHVVRYAPLAEHTIELFLLTDDTQALRDHLAGLCPTMDAYSSKDGYLLRVRGDQAMIKRVVTSPGIRHWWFVEHERTANAPPVRFAYEILFDPRTKTWQVPS